jgi:hypothetical protein
MHFYGVGKDLHKVSKSSGNDPKWEYLGSRKDKDGAE